MSVHDVLHTNRWQTKRVLAEKLGTTTREVELQIEAARKAAELPIMSGPDGYRLAVTIAEYEQNVDRRRRRAVNQLLTVRGERAYLRRWKAWKDAQPTLWQDVA